MLIKPLPVLLTNRVPVETVLLLAEDKGKGKRGGVLGGESRDFKWKNYEVKAGTMESGNPVGPVGFEKLFM